jgi:hypothetical protein
MIFAEIRNRRDARRPLRARIPVLAAGVTAVAVCAAGCGSGGFNGIYSIPLPGGATWARTLPGDRGFGNVVDRCPCPR